VSRLSELRANWGPREWPRCCRSCMGTATRVLHTHQDVNGNTRRERQCGECSHVFRTVENPNAPIRQ
jgi:transcriptional regulator NrdR family protein